MLASFWSWACSGLLSGVGTCGRGCERQLLSGLLLCRHLVLFDFAHLNFRRLNLLLYLSDLIFTEVRLTQLFQAFLNLC